MRETQTVSELVPGLRKRIDELSLRLEELDRESRLTRERLETFQSALRVEIELEPVARPHASSNGHARANGGSLNATLSQLKLQYPDWGHSQLRDRLVADGFDFGGKNEGQAVNAVLQRWKREAKRQEARQQQI